MITYTINAQQVTPANSGTISIVGSKFEESGAFEQVKELSEDLILKGDDYQLIKSLTGECDVFNLTIEQACGASTFTVFTGVFTVKDCTFEDDRKQVKCQVREDTILRCFLDQYGKDLNLLEINGAFQDHTCFKASIGRLDRNDDSEMRFEILITEVGDTSPQATYGLRIWQINLMGQQFWFYARVIITTRCIDGVPQQPQVVDASDYDFNLITSACPGYSTWYSRLPTGLQSINFAGSISVTTGTPPAGSYLLNDVAIGPTTYAFYFDPDDIDNTTINGGRGLMGTVSFYLSNMGCGLNPVSSQFFTNATNPITGGESYTNNLYITQKSNITQIVRTPQGPKDFGVTEPATILKTSLRAILEDLNTLFNARWRINTGTNTMEIEHISDFNLGAVGLDLTTAQYAKYITNRNSIEYDNFEVPVAEEFGYPIDASSLNFERGLIEYAPDCAVTDKVVLNTNILETEIQDTLGIEAAGLDGAILYDPDQLNSWRSSAQEGCISSTFEPNAGLGYSCLLRDFLLYDRPLDAGDVNGAPTVMQSNRRIKRVRNLNVPFCCLNDFDPTQLVKIEQGDAEVKGYRYQLAKKILSLDLAL